MKFSQNSYYFKKNYFYYKCNKKYLVNQFIMESIFNRAFFWHKIFKSRSIPYLT